MRIKLFNELAAIGLIAILAVNVVGMYESARYYFPFLPSSLSHFFP